MSERPHGVKILVVIWSLNAIFNLGIAFFRVLTGIGMMEGIYPSDPSLPNFIETIINTLRVLGISENAIVIVDSVKGLLVGIEGSFYIISGVIYLALATIYAYISINIWYMNRPAIWKAILINILEIIFFISVFQTIPNLIIQFLCILSIGVIIVMSGYLILRRNLFINRRKVQEEELLEGETVPNQRPMIFGIIGGVILILVQRSGRIPIVTWLPLLLGLVFVPEMTPELITLLIFLDILAWCGGFIVIAGVVLLWRENYKGAKFLMGIGSGFGIVGLLTWFIIDYVFSGIYPIQYTTIQYVEFLGLLLVLLARVTIRAPKQWKRILEHRAKEEAAKERWKSRWRRFTSWLRK
ncbi:MAG: hypothetical protein ACFE89_05595 [Candidatus Hodarchaeota archaeon]